MAIDPDNESTHVLPVKPCECDSAGYCKMLGRHMTEARWSQCNQSEEYRKVFQRAASEGTFRHEAYQKPPSEHDVPQRTRISMPRSRAVGNFMRAIPRIARSRKLSRQEMDARHEVCLSCEFFDGRSCDICGCRVRMKRRYESERCPVLRWTGDRELYSFDLSRTIVIATAMTTCKRKEPTVNESLQSVADAGFDRPLVVEDLDKMGAWNTFRRALATLISHRPQADAYLMLQDDIRVSANCRSYVQKALWPSGSDTGACSLYCSGMYEHGDDGWNRHTTDTFGALAICFTPLSARLFIAGTSPSRRGEAQVDLRVGRWCRLAGMSYWIHYPSLVEHTGMTSTISGLPMMRSRRAKAFCEDASTLQGDHSQTS